MSSAIFSLIFRNRKVGDRPACSGTAFVNYCLCSINCCVFILCWLTKTVTIKDKVVPLLDFLKASSKYLRPLIRSPLGVICDTVLRNLTKVDKQIRKNSVCEGAQFLARISYFWELPTYISSETNIYNMFVLIRLL